MTTEGRVTMSVLRLVHTDALCCRAVRCNATHSVWVNVQRYKTKDATKRSQHDWHECARHTCTEDSASLSSSFISWLSLCTYARSTALVLSLMTVRRTASGVISRNLSFQHGERVFMNCVRPCIISTSLAAFLHTPQYAAVCGVHGQQKFRRSTIPLINSCTVLRLRRFVFYHIYHITKMWSERRHVANLNTAKRWYRSVRTHKWIETR